MTNGMTSGMTIGMTIGLALAVMLTLVGAANAQNKERWNPFKKKDPPKTDAAQPPADAGAPRKVGDKEVWTIECKVCSGPDHAKDAELYARSLRGVDRLRPDAVTISAEKDRSRLFYGRYELKYVRPMVGGRPGDLVVEQSKPLKDDLAYIKQLASGSSYPFLTARAIPVPIEDIGPPEWDLRNAKGVYTLHVGVTYPTPELRDYKAAAVEWVKVLRADGYEAYYYHHPDRPKSDICVGTFGADAVIDQKGGGRRYSDAVISLQSKGDFKWNLENGLRVTKTVPPSKENPQGMKVINQSFLVEIPGQEEKAKPNPKVRAPRR